MLGLPDGKRLLRGADTLWSLPQRGWASRRACRGLPGLRASELFLTNASGYRVFVRCAEPDDEAARAAVVVVPGRGGSADRVGVGTYVVGLPELAARGLRAFVFDPVGRGRSWGHDDFAGSEGQDSLRAVLDLVHGRRDVRTERVTVLSCSAGLCLAAHVLAREADRLGTRALIDWEGPADRDAILRGGPLPPAARPALARDPDGFWARREPIQAIDDLPCGYLRVQGARDHALHERGWEGARRLLAAAAGGRAAWVRVNDAPTGELPRPDAESAGAPERAAPLAAYLLDKLVALSQ